MKRLVAALVLVGLAAWGALHLLHSHYVSQGTDTRLPPPFGQLASISTPLGKPQEGDWLACYEERGQTFREYADGRRDEPLDHGAVICTALLGEASPQQRKLFAVAAEYLECLFGLPVRAIKDLPADLMPAEARRQRRSDTDEQFLTPYITHTLVPPRRPADCAVFVVFTAHDLWAGEGWNRVYGEASSSRRTAVCSIHQFGDDLNDSQCLARTLKLVSHEVLHVFDLNHCIFYECLMCGANNLDEVDRYPLTLCPHCLGKTCHALRPRGAAHGAWADPAPLVARLAAFSRKYELAEDARRFEEQHRILERR